ncbi:hypothetical protein GCM10010201_11800 [Pilimelia columellifera subsp. columellifera]|uniref:Uncharacterized protein n=2 Tax=Pilimelia TaxID=53370 RepID=A0ABN3N999_9ACTN
MSLSALRRLVVGGAVVSAIVAGGLAPATAAPRAGVETLGTPRPITRAFAYPLTPGDEGWERLTTHREMVEATQLPAETARQMSTEALVETVLDYPLFLDVKAFNSDQQGLDRVARRFNGFAELFRRDDAGAVLLPRYEAFEPTGAGPRAADRGERQLDGWKLELLLAQPQVLSTLAPDRLDAALAAGVRVYDGKVAARADYGAAGLQPTGLLMGRALAARDGWDWRRSAFLTTGRGPDAAPAQVRAAAAGTGRDRGRPPADLVSPARLGKVQTPNGSSIEVEQRSEDLTDVQLRNYHTYVASLYPRAARETSASRRYNCHSYAWHSQAPSNNSWMMSPGDDIYWQDGSYQIWRRNLPYLPGMRWSWGSDDHSGFEVGKSGRVRSKWGELPVMTHSWEYSPYEDAAVNRYYKA